MLIHREYAHKYFNRICPFPMNERKLLHYRRPGPAVLYVLRHILLLETGKSLTLLFFVCFWRNGILATSKTSISEICHIFLGEGEFYARSNTINVVQLACLVPREPRTHWPAIHTSPALGSNAVENINILCNQNEALFRLSAPQLAVFFSATCRGRAERRMLLLFQCRE